DVMVTTVSPMDKAGYFSFGTSNDFCTTAARCCKKLIVEVNEKMPRVFGDSLLHISEVDAVVENTVPLLELKSPPGKPEDEIIGKLVAEMVPDGATIQLGFGGLPNAVTRYLMNHKDLGIHTELFGSGMVDLIERGVVTGKKKNLHPRKNLFTVAQGTKKMYDFLNDNPSIESYPVSYINEPSVIAQNDNMISINSIIDVDLTGQCNAEYLDGTQFSGTGGQLDFVRGAFNSKGGKSILAFYSTAKKGTVSRVVPHFAPGTVVTTPRMDTHFLITEYGVVNLKGKSTRERALDIISIAHPKFRDELLREAENMHLV
ncbi:MAG: 4-hydroxybutyrate--acetyl-CoA CoA transferase, partial [Chloroflexi bacterium]|nr:4-hydroxybutyrate--acetyl-CoA CoA transferase [Chloroflexota bacterium]